MSYVSQTNNNANKMKNCNLHLVGVNLHLVGIVVVYILFFHPYFHLVLELVTN